MKFSKPNLNLLLITAALLVICSFFLVDQTFDIRIFETFYVFELKTIYLCGAFLLTVCYLLYRLLPALFSSISLINTQIVLTIVAILLIIGYHLGSGQNKMLGRPLNLYDVDVFHKNNLALTILLFVLAFVQVTMLINILKSQLLMRKNAKKI